MNNKYSNLKIAWFPEKLRSLLENRVTAPIYIRIKPTNRCCHDCYFCVYNYSFSNMHDTMQKTDEIPTPKMMEILEDLEFIGVKAITYSGGGEPLIHKDIVDILDKTLNCGLDLSMLTNGQLLNGPRANKMVKAKWIRVSMNYWNEDMFKKTRNISPKGFHQIIDNLSSFSAIKENCDLGINYIITQENHENVIEAFDFLSTTGIDNIRFSPLWIPNFFEYHQPIKNKVISQLEQIRKNNNTKVAVYDSYKINSEVNQRNYTKCYFCQVVPVIGADCNVYNCHNKAYDHDGIIGSIKNKKFSDMWFSKETDEYFKNFRPDILCNHQCANNQKNILIHEMINNFGDNYV